MSEDGKEVSGCKHKLCLHIWRLASWCYCCSHCKSCCSKGCECYRCECYKYVNNEDNAIKDKVKRI